MEFADIGSLEIKKPGKMTGSEVRSVKPDRVLITSKPEQRTNGISQKSYKYPDNVGVIDQKRNSSLEAIWRGVIAVLVARVQLLRAGRPAR